MGRSLEKRLDGNVEAFLECVEENGDWEALQIWKKELDGYHDYVGLRKFIVEHTGDENYGLYPKLGKYYRDGIEAMLRSMLGEFANYVIRTDKMMKIKDQQIEINKIHRQKVESGFAEQILSITEALQKG